MIKFNNFFHKRWFKILAICLVVGGLLTGGVTYVAFNYFGQPTIVEKTSPIFLVSIEGAVEKPGDYTFDQPQTVRQIIFQANLKTTADTSSLNLEEVINKDTEISIPYRVGSIEKLKWKDLKSAEQLLKLGVRKKIANLVMDHRSRNEETTWKQIESISGIGPVTINHLQGIIELGSSSL